MEGALSPCATAHCVDGLPRVVAYPSVGLMVAAASAGHVEAMEEDVCEASRDVDSSQVPRNPSQVERQTHEREFGVLTLCNPGRRNCMPLSRRLIPPFGVATTITTSHRTL